MEYGVESDNEMEYGVESDNEIEYGVESDNEMEYGIGSESDKEVKMTPVPRTSVIAPTVSDASQPRPSPQASEVQTSTRDGHASSTPQIPHPRVSPNPSPSYEPSISERPGPQYSVIKMSAAHRARRGPLQLGRMFDRPFHPLSTTRRASGSAGQSSIYPPPGDFWARKPGPSDPRPSTLVSYERESTRRWDDANPTSTSSASVVSGPQCRV